MTKSHYFFSAFGFICICLLLSCAARNDDFASKKAYAVSKVKEFYGTSSKPLGQHLLKVIMATLTNLDAQAVSTPKVVSCVLIKGRDNPTGTNYGVQIYWTEDKLSINDIQMRMCSNTITNDLGPFRRFEKQNSELDGKTILFYDECVWTNDCELLKSLVQGFAQKDCEVRLMHNREPRSNWVPVEFYNSSLMLWEASNTIGGTNTIGSGP